MNHACLKPLRISIGLFAMLFFPALSVTGNAANDNKPSTISFDFPGATDTQATAITPSGDIVGRYFTPDGVRHGFLLHEKRFTTIDPPDSVSAEANWINPRGDIGGSYTDRSGINHGFVLSHGRYSTVDYPGGTSTAVFGISASGELVGSWNDTQGVLHGFLAQNGHFMPFDFPGASGSLPTMIAAGILTGGYFGPSGTHGLVVSHGEYRSIDCPGGTFTFLSGVDPEGNTVGGFGTPDGHYHGALIKNNNCIRVDYPGSTDTWANGSNPQGDLVGRYVDAGGVTHAYLLRHYIDTATPVYSASQNFSFTANPNSVWSYGYSYSLGDFSLYTLHGSTYFSGEDGWFGPIPSALTPGFPLVVAEPNTIPAVLDMGPGPGSYTIVRWTAPTDGVWDVVGDFFGTGLTTADVHVLRNGVPVFDSPVNGLSVADFSLSIRLKAGDKLDFPAGPGPNGDDLFDSTGFNVTITPEL